jgi:hypothetical protein
MLGASYTVPELETLTRREAAEPGVSLSWP